MGKQTSKDGTQGNSIMKRVGFWEEGGGGDISYGYLAIM